MFNRYFPKLTSGYKENKNFKQCTLCNHAFSNLIKCMHVCYNENQKPFFIDKSLLIDYLVPSTCSWKRLSSAENL